MDERNKNTRNKLKDISSVEDLKTLLEAVTLSDVEKQIIWMIYKEQKDIGYIADTLGICERAVKRKHKNSLIKIGKLFA